MNGNDIISLGLGIEAPWKISGQTLNTDHSPHELRITLLGLYHARGAHGGGMLRFVASCGNGLQRIEHRSTALAVGVAWRVDVPTYRALLAQCSST